VEESKKMNSPKSARFFFRETREGIIVGIRPEADMTDRAAPFDQTFGSPASSFNSPFISIVFS